MDATIVIPTFNRWDALQETLEALVLVDYPANSWEVIVVDDGSNDGTEKSIGEWIERSVLNVRYIKQANSGPAAARNRGAAAACGKILIFIDNDIIVRPDFVRAHVAAVAENSGAWVMGRVVHPPELRQTTFGRYRDSVWEAFHDEHAKDGPCETTGMTAANLSMPAADFQKLGGFDEDFTIASCEDCDLGIRARHAGVRIIYESRIIVLHNDWAISLDRFCERQRLYSISDALLWRKYGSASPRASLVQQNSPIRWRHDKPGLIIKKMLKRVLATRLGSAMTRVVCIVAERIVPDTGVSRRAYETATGNAIFKGVREGLQRYKSVENRAGRADELSRPPRALKSGVVCHLIDASLDTNYFRSIAQHHDRDRYPVMIGSLATPGSLQQAMTKSKTPTFSLGAVRRWQYPFAILRLARLLRREHIAVLHAHCFDATFVGLIASRMARVPFVFTRHHSDHNIRLGKRWHTRIDSWCARHADHVIAVSDSTRRVMRSIEGVTDNQITVVYNGLEPLRQPTEQEVECAKHELGLADSTVCLMVARLHEEKGHRFLFDAIREIQSQCGRVIFLLAGDGPHWEKLREDVRARGLEDTVRFLGRRDDVAVLISLASVVVLPSLAESFGFVVLEAMSLGTPVVAAATGGIPELVTDGENGLLVPAADSRALALAISRVLSDSGLALALAERGRKSVTAFSFERMIRGYEGIYATVVAKSRAMHLDTRTSTESAGNRTIAG